jgi:hypothetical protein
MLGLFRVKNHDFTPKNNIFSNLGGPAAPPPPESAPGDHSLYAVFWANFGYV